MRVPSRVVFLAIALVIASGCMHRIDTIGVDNPESTQSLSMGSKVSVMKLAGSAAFEHDAAIQLKMAKILGEKGYVVTERDSAEYFLLYDYRVKGKMAHMKLELLTGPREGMHTVRRGGPYTHALELRVVDAPLYRQNNRRDALIWQGGAVMGDVPTGSSKFHDLVLVAAFEQLGKTTDDAVSVIMRMNISEAKKLLD